MQHSTLKTTSLLALLLTTPAMAQTMTDLQSPTPPTHSLWLETLDLSKMTSGYNTAQAGKSVDGHPLTLDGVAYPHGVGTHAPSAVTVNLHGAATHFASVVGVDSETGGAGTVTFTVSVDGKVAARTPLMHGGDKPQLISVDLTGAQTMALKVGDGGDGINSDHADWAGAEITLADNAASQPEAIVTPTDPPRLVMLPPDTRPAIHGPRVVGATPGRPFLFLIPATGQGPLHYAAQNLPAGLTLDPKTGIITGTLQKAGAQTVTLTVRGPMGTATRGLSIVGGVHRLALTPPMGWNSWDAFTRDIDDKKTRASADAFVSTGLAAHGYQYVNIDDTWEAGRDAQGRIQTNSKFPDVKALCDYIHDKGLKFGIYSSPGPKTCGGYEASYQHEDQDAQSYSDWGVDYLKYDWCSYDDVVKKDHSLPNLKRPYAVMRASLDKVNRDMVFSYCQYGMGDVWTWGAALGGNLWRTNGDLQDDWGDLHGTFESENGHEKYAGPGHWNDPDMLSVGYFNWGPIHPTHLTPNEQITQFSIWSLIAAPLLIGGDVTRLDPFTLALLSNDEAIDVDQDPLGHAAGRVAQVGNTEVWARPLLDGTHAVGLVNVDSDTATVTVHWSDLGITGPQTVRDLWLHKNVGTYNGSYSVEVPSHGCVLLKIGKARFEK